LLAAPIVQRLSHVRLNADAHEFARIYAGLRAAGANPCVRQHHDGGIGEQFAVGCSVTGDVTPLYDWARKGDSDWALRREYARSVWDNRPASDLPTVCQFVPLGAVQ
jgi:hypothetical protein